MNELEILNVKVETLDWIAQKIEELRDNSESEDFNTGIQAAYEEITYNTLKLLEKKQELLIAKDQQDRAA